MQWASKGPDIQSGDRDTKIPKVQVRTKWVKA